MSPLELSNMKLALQNAAGRSLTFVEMPVLFLGEPQPITSGPDGRETSYFSSHGKATALTPNLANAQVMQGTLYLPEPEGPRTSAGDLFRNWASAQGIGVAFVHDWYPYHVNFGEVHCGTNVRREIPEKLWWRMAR